MKKLFVAIALFLCWSGIHAQKTLIPEDLWKLGMVSDPQPSPDGKSVLFSVKYTSLDENKGNADLYTIGLDGQNLKRLTQTPGSENNARWRPDGKKIGYLLVDNGSMQLHEVNPDGTGSAKVSSEEGGMDGFEYAPTGDKILFHKAVSMDKPDAGLYKGLPKASGKIYDALLFRHWTDWADGSYNHVFMQSYADGKLLSEAKDIMAGERFDCPVKPMGGVEQITWRPDGMAIAYTCKKKNGTADATSTNTDIYLFDLQSRTTTNLTQGMMGYDMEPRFSPDGKKMAWQSMARDGYEADKNRLMIRDFATGITLDATQTSDITVEAMAWSSNSQKVYFHVLTQGTIQVYQWDSKAPVAQAIKPVTKGEFNYTSIGVVKNGKTDLLIGTRQTISGPNEIWKIDPDYGGAQSQVTQINTTYLAGFKLGKVEKRMVKATDGKDILTWVVYPPDFDPAKKYPAMLMCQGGPQSMVGQNFSMRWNFQLMASQGYIMVLPNRRGLPGFGQEWTEAISGHWGDQAMKDLLSVTDDISREAYVDKDKLGAVGASYGGYSVYWLAGNHQKRFKTFIAHCGVFNLESMYGATEELWFSDWEMKGPYWKEPKPESYSKYSPHLFVKNWDTPMLVIHNDKDFRVPIGEGLQAFTAAQLKSIPSRFLFFPDEGHWVLKPQNSVLWNRVFFDWLGRTLK